MLLVVLAATFAACQNKKADAKAHADSVATDSTQKVDPTLGAMQTRDFTATLAGPTSAGVINEIVVKKQEKATQGTYEWLKTYPKGNNGSDMTTRQKGIVKDTADTKGKKIWVLHKGDSETVNYFEVHDGKIIQLDPSMKKTSESKNFVFKEKKAK